MDNSDDYTLKEKIQMFLDLQPDEITNHLTVVDVHAADLSNYLQPGVMGDLPMIRIDKQLPPKFFPNMPRSAMPQENSSIARITCAPSLLGCLIGYFRAEEDLLRSGRPGYRPDPQYKGGYHISKLTPSMVVKPGAELVPDQPRSDEHWIVAFDEDHVEFTPQEIGKCFITELTHYNRGDKPAEISLTLMVEVTGEDSLFLAKQHILKPGYWKVRIKWETIFARDLRRSQTEIQSCVAISQADYTLAKGLSANLLSYEAPAHTSW